MDRPRSTGGRYPVDRGWCSLAIWFKGIGDEAARDLLAGAIFVSALVTVGFLATSWRWRAFAAYGALVAVILVWWSTILPSNDRDWTPDVARSVTATIEGDRLVVSNVRNFTWRSDTDFDQRWEQRTYNLSHLTNLDLIMSYWGNEAIAHTIVSFGFDDGPRLAFSIETRKERGEAYSTIAGSSSNMTWRSSRPTNGMSCVCAATFAGRMSGCTFADSACQRAGAAARIYQRGKPACAHTTFLQHSDRKLHHAGVRDGRCCPSGITPRLPRSAIGIPTKLSL